MWLVRELDFTDGVVLPVGFHAVPFDASRPHSYSDEDVNAARRCAERLHKESHKDGECSRREWPLICDVFGRLRVIVRDALTDIRPEVEREAYGTGKE